MESSQIEKLKEYFKGRDDVAFAFLYGSQAKGNATRLSDFDIAVYFYPWQRHPIELEEEIYYDGENNIWGNLELILKKEA
ncbi:MAG: Nucleotidyltransferase protein, partial [Candidatus Poribacteria bacterium]|nr:Nucleotidyltransferase protein [Candidatus Poribacteria bacterium]